MTRYQRRKLGIKPTIHIAAGQRSSTGLCGQEKADEHVVMLGPKFSNCARCRETRARLIAESDRYTTWSIRPPARPAAAGGRRT